MTDRVMKIIAIAAAGVGVFALVQLLQFTLSQKPSEIVTRAEFNLMLQRNKKYREGVADSFLHVLQRIKKLEDRK